MKKIVCSILFAILCTCVLAQDAERDIEQIIADIFDQYTAETDDDIDFETFSQDLLYFSEQKLNLNLADRESLEKLVFLNDIQIENILYYIYNNQKLNSLYELQLIEGLDMTDIRRMLPFVCLGEANTPSTTINKYDLLKYGKSEFLFRFDFNPEKKKGYIPQGGEDAAYAGARVYNYSKYKYHYRDRIYAGFSLENDAGEKFFSKQSIVYDFKSFYVQLNEFSNFKTIVLGDYKASFGQGLVLNSNFGMSKSSLVLNVNQRNQGLKKYSSTNEFNFFRGFGATYLFNNIETSVFYSNKFVDADTTGAVISGFSEIGLHRTTSEIERKGTVLQQVLGFNSSYTNQYFQVGATLVHTWLNFPIVPNLSAYKIYGFSGRIQTTAGLNYRFRLNKFYFSGETAIDQGFHPATVNSLSLSPHSLVNLVMLYRYYSPAYDTFYANSFSEGSSISNESGLYTGLEVRPYKKWKISAFFDSYRFPWLKYLVDAPTLGKDYFVQVDYSKSRYINMFLRLKFEEKEVTQKLEEESIAQRTISHKFSSKYQLNYRVENLEFKTVMEYKLSSIEPADFGYGFSVLQDLSYEFKRLPLRVDFRYQFFDAMDYDNRFYSYERDILYAFSIPMYYGLGSRYYVNIKYDLNENISFWAKIAQTKYSDGRELIGTANEEILGNKKTDIRLLLRWKL